MFEDLKKAINIENLNKIKKNNNQLRYKQEESSEEHP